MSRSLSKSILQPGTKIIDLDDLAQVAARLRQEGKVIVHCHGVFDLLHIGHIRYFKQALKYGDVLIVTLTPDDFVDKGPHRPAFPQDLRAEAISSLGFVDYVAINKWPTACEILRLLRPHYYVKGAEFKTASSDRTGKIEEEKKVLEEIGATFAYTDDVVFSSSNLINRYLSTFSEEVNNYLTLFRTRYTLDGILDLLDRMATLRVMVIGDTILDEYQYCEAIGKSSKDPTLVVKYQSHELFAGGILAVANHIANFTDKVELFTVLGDRERYEDFISSRLNKTIVPHFFTQENAPTTLKRRLIDGYAFNKLFEVYVMNDAGLSQEENNRLLQLLKEKIDEFDVVIVADFGHGAIDQAVRELLIDRSLFLTVNTQANAGNRGFHTISKYRKFDYACIAGHELALETRERSCRNLRKTIYSTLKRLEGKQLVVTQGRNGCASCTEDGTYVQVPSFAEKVVDRVGAGDVFFAITSLAAALGASQEVSALLGNVVGSLAVEIIGNKKPIDKQAVEKYLTSLMK